MFYPAHYIRALCVINGLVDRPWSIESIYDWLFGDCKRLEVEKGVVLYCGCIDIKRQAISSQDNDLILIVPNQFDQTAYLVGQHICRKYILETNWPAVGEFMLHAVKKVYFPLNVTDLKSSDNQQGAIKPMNNPFYRHWWIHTAGYTGRFYIFMTLTWPDCENFHIMKKENFIRTQNLSTSCAH